MSGVKDPEVHRRLHHEMMRNIEWEHKKPNGMTSRLLTRAETNAFEHNMLTMYQTMMTLAQTRMSRVREGWSSRDLDSIYQLRTDLKELNVNISYMSKEEFEVDKNNAELRELSATNLKQAHALAYAVENILNETEEDREAEGNSQFHWEDGLLHMELDGVISNISNLVHALLPGYLQ